MKDISFASHLRTAIMNQRIYPAGNPIVERSISQALQSIESILTHSDRTTLTTRDGKVFLKSKEVPDANALSPILEEHGIQSLTFSKGVTSGEINKLVLLLSKKGLKNQNLADWFQQQDITHIHLDKVTIVEMMEGQVLIQKLDILFDRINNFPELVSSLREAYDAIDTLSDDKQKTDAQEHLAKQLSTLEPSLIKDIFGNSLPKRVEESGLRTDVLNAMTQDKLRDIFSEIGQWYRQIRSQSASDFEVVEHLNKLKSFLGKLLSSPASKNVPFSIYEELLNQGLLEKIPPGVQKADEEESISSQVDHLLEKPASALLELPTRDKLPIILKKLCAVGLDELIQKLLSKFQDNFLEEASLLRGLAAKTSVPIMENLWVNHKGYLANDLYAALLKLAEQERLTDVYKDVIETISKMTIHFYINREFNKAIQALSLMRRHNNQQNIHIPKQSELAGQAIKKAAEQTIDLLTEDFLSQEKSAKEASGVFLSHLSETAVPCFIDIVKKSIDPRERRMAVSALKYHEEEAKTVLAQEFHVGNPTTVLLNLLSVIKEFPSYIFIPMLEPFVHFPDVLLRTEIIRLLSHIQDENATALILQFLDAREEPVQIEAIRAVGEIKSREALPKLIDFLLQESTARREEACIALGKINDTRAVHALLQTLEIKTGLFKKTACAEESVRIRAAWALSQMQSAEARNALSKFSQDPNQQIQSIARQISGL